MLNCLSGPFSLHVCSSKQCIGLDYLLSLSGKNCILEGLLQLLKLHMHVQKTSPRSCMELGEACGCRGAEKRRLRLLCGLLSWPFCMVKVEFAIMAFSLSLPLERLRLHSLAVNGGRFLLLWAFPHTVRHLNFLSKIAIFRKNDKISI